MRQYQGSVVFAVFQRNDCLSAHINRIGGLVGILKICRHLKDEEKLKELRLKETDERELEMGSLALFPFRRISGLFSPAPL